MLWAEWQVDNETFTEVVVVMAQDFDGFGGDAKFCTPYSCPKDHEAVPKWSLTFVCPRNVAAWAGCKYFQVGMP